MKAFTIMGRTFKAAYDELFLCVFLSLVWWLGTVLIVTAAPATVGLFNVTNRIANYKRADTSFFWESARQNIGRGWLLYAISLLGLGAILFNAIFYFNADGWLRAFGVFWVWLFVYCLMFSQYLFPLFWQQDEPDLKLVFRNAALLALRHPLYTFLMLLFQIFLFVLSVLLTLPVLLLMPAMVALAANFALTGLLQEMGLAPLPPETPRR
ncbi:MAG: hypothetical protein HC802_19530 [Caldilineaceae bacterium]|nr:hypothetical protein [Caldilineaceae bacterium]